MGLAPIDGVAVGQSQRIDQNGDAFRQRIQEGANLEIPKSGIDRTRDEHTDPAQTTTQAGMSQDDATKERGEAWSERRLNLLNRFEQGRKKPPGGTVVIDQGLKESTPIDPLVKRPKRPDDDTEAWRRWNDAHLTAAEQEEDLKDRPGPFTKPPPKGRRRYVLVNSR